MKSQTRVDSFPLANSKKGVVEILHIEHPYGEHSYPVVKVEVSEFGEKRSIEIPYANLNQLLDALNQSKSVCHTFPHNYHHLELASKIGGGE